MLKELFAGDPIHTTIRDLQNGDILVLNPGEYHLSPPDPEARPETAQGAAVLHGKRNVRIVGVGNPTINLRNHGTGLLIHDCSDIEIDGIRFVGRGRLRTENKSSFALLELYGTNTGIKVENCGFFESGNHGIAHLWGERRTSDSIFRDNVFRHGGNYARGANRPGETPLQFDGAAIAVGGARNFFTGNRISDWLRGIEIENPYKTSSDCCVIDGNLVERCTWQSILVTPDGLPGSGMAAFFKLIRITNNIIVGTGTRTEKVSNTGIYVTGGFAMHIVGNQISDIADGIGILLQTDHSEIKDCVISGNLIRNCDRTGIQLSRGQASSPHDNHVTGNTLRRIGGRGIFVEGVGNLVSRNDIVGVQWEPIYCIEPDNVITSNNFADFNPSKPPKIP